MAEDSALEALGAACAAISKRSDLDVIRSGSTITLRGRAAPADPGTLALATETGARVIMNRDDICSVERDGEDYLVEVRSGSDLLARFETVVRADARTCECPAHSDTEQAVARSSKFTIGIDPAGCVWSTELRCVFGVVGGILRAICVPVPVRHCPSPGVGPPPA
jgi:hypothetical protein